MTRERPLAPDLMKTPSTKLRNPHILHFCKALVERKGEQHEPEALKKLLDDMYGLYENMLGQNMVKALPENIRQEYLKLCENLDDLNYEKIGEFFDENIPDYREIMKETMQEFTRIFMRNRTFNVKDYPVSPEAGAPARVPEGEPSA